MINDLQTDEYGISISREITVCKNMIERQRKHLIRFEKQYGFFTEEVIKKESMKIETKTRDIDQWRNEYEGLLAWQQRLREYEAAYEELRR